MQKGNSSDKLFPFREFSNVAASLARVNPFRFPDKWRQKFDKGKAKRMKLNKHTSCHERDKEKRVGSELI